MAPARRNAAEGTDRGGGADAEAGKGKRGRRGSEGSLRSDKVDMLVGEGCGGGGNGRQPPEERHGVVVEWRWSGLPASAHGLTRTMQKAEERSLLYGFTPELAHGSL